MDVWQLGTGRIGAGFEREHGSGGWRMEDGGSIITAAKEWIQAERHGIKADY